MIRDDIKTALIAAMKGGDKDTVGTLRLAQAAIKNRDIELRTAATQPDDDAMVTEVLQKMIKQRRESADLYRKGGREDRAAAEEAEIAVIERLPARAIVATRRPRAKIAGDHRRNRRDIDEGHGQGHGRGEERSSAPRSNRPGRARW